MNKYLKTFLLVSFGAGFLLTESAQAQQVPSTADPGIIARDLEQPDRAPSRIEDTVTLGDEKIDGQGFSTEELFTMQNLVLDGTTVYSSAEVDAILADYIGQPTSFADLNAMARALTVAYRTDGYMFSRVILPPQEIEGGIVHLQAIEGRLTEVELVGTYKDNNHLIQDLADKITSAGPTNTDELERYLLLIDDLPGIKARSVLQPSETPGGGKLVITIEQDPFEGSVGIDNRGSKFLGQTRGTIVGAVNSMFGIHDRTTLRGILTKDRDELRFFDITHEEQIGSEGLRIKGWHAVTLTEPGGSLKPNQVKGESRIYDVEALYPVIRSRQYNVNLIGGFTALNSQSSILGINVAEDRVRYLRAGGRFDFTDSFAGVTQVDLQLTQGIDVFNATDDGLGRSRANGEHDFLRSNLSVVRLQDLPGQFSMQLSGEGQYSDDPLLASEEFSVGGGQFGRAYDSGEIAGDRGIAGAVELRYGGPVDHDFVHSYQVYGFYDVGKVWNEAPAVAESAVESLASTGLGVRFNLNYDLSGYVEFNKPLTRNVSAEGDDDLRLFFNFLKRF